MEKSFKERRMHVRIYRNFILSYRQKGGSGAAHEISQIHNISQGGLNFASTQILKEGAIMTIDLKTPFIADPIRLEGVVLECKEKINGLIYEIRLQFKDVAAKELAVLEKIENYGTAGEN